MSIDLNFWKYKKDVYLDNAIVYQNVCCDNEEIDGLEDLPIENILKEIAIAFHDWNTLNPFNYESKEEHGSFQISTTPQTIRFDCYSLAQANMKRFSSIMSSLDVRYMTHNRVCALTKVTSSTYFGNAWANRPCQCKTAQLDDKEKAPQLLAELLQKSIVRVVNDFFERTCCE